MSSQVTFTIPPALWMTSNRPIANHAHKARIVRRLHDIAADMAMVQHLDRFGPAQLDAIWFIAYPKGTGWTHGDAANAHPTCKALLDGLVPKWLDGDGPNSVVVESYTRAPNATLARIHDVTLRLVAHQPIGATP